MEMMSREDWRHITGPYETDDDIKIRPGVDGKSLIVVFSGARMKQVAGACLYDQEYGFTWLDVFRHREQADYRRRFAGTDPEWAPAHKEYADWHDSMADRIEELLPPKDLVEAANLPGTPIDY